MTQEVDIKSRSPSQFDQSDLLRHHTCGEVSSVRLFRLLQARKSYGVRGAMYPTR